MSDLELLSDVCATTMDHSGKYLSLVHFGTVSLFYYCAFKISVCILMKPHSSCAIQLRSRTFRKTFRWKINNNICLFFNMHFSEISKFVCYQIPWTELEFFMFHNILWNSSQFRKWVNTILHLISSLQYNWSICMCALNNWFELY